MYIPVPGKATKTAVRPSVAAGAHDVGNRNVNGRQEKLRLKKRRYLIGENIIVRGTGVI